MFAYPFPFFLVLQCIPPLMPITHVKQSRSVFDLLSADISYCLELVYCLEADVLLLYYTAVFVTR